MTYMRRLLVPTVLIVAAESLTEASQIATGPGAGTGAYSKRSSHTATCLAAARLRGGGLSTAGTTVAALVASLGALIALNIAQNGGTSHPPPSCSDAAGLLALTSKADAVALWRASPAPTIGGWSGEWEGRLLPLGVLAPVSALITHNLFGPASRWSGKAFSADGGSGANLFERGPPRRAFRASVAPSTLDGRPVLSLDYAAAGEPLWGTVLGMRDELREVAPGVLLGLGGMRASGGVRNAAPFVLVRKTA